MMKAQEGTMAYEVEVQQLTPQPAATIRTTTTPNELGSRLASSLDDVGHYLRSAGVSAAGAPFARYYAYDRNHVDMEAGIPVSRPVEGEGQIQGSELPGGTAAGVWHIGPRNKLFRAWGALQAWLKDNGWEEAEAGWEAYATGPDEEPDSSRWKTQVVQPIKRVPQER
jgi:effector-binding domain-containing protein